MKINGIYFVNNVNRYKYYTVENRLISQVWNLNWFSSIFLGERTAKKNSNKMKITIFAIAVVSLLHMDGLSGAPAEAIRSSSGFSSSSGSSSGSSAFYSSGSSSEDSVNVASASGASSYVASDSESTISSSSGVETAASSGAFATSSSSSASSTSTTSAVFSKSQQIISGFTNIEATYQAALQTLAEAWFAWQSSGKYENDEVTFKAALQAGRQARETYIEQHSLCLSEMEKVKTSWSQSTSWSESDKQAYIQMNSLWSQLDGQFEAAQTDWEENVKKYEQSCSFSSSSSSTSGSSSIASSTSSASSAASAHSASSATSETTQSIVAKYSKEFASWKEEMDAYKTSLSACEFAYKKVSSATSASAQEKKQFVTAYLQHQKLQRNYAALVKKCQGVWSKIQAESESSSQSAWASNSQLYSQISSFVTTMKQLSTQKSSSEEYDSLYKKCSGASTSESSTSESSSSGASSSGKATAIAVSGCSGGVKTASSSSSSSSEITQSSMAKYSVEVADWTKKFAAYKAFSSACETAYRRVSSVTTASAEEKKQFIEAYLQLKKSHSEYVALYEKSRSVLSKMQAASKSSNQSEWAKEVKNKVSSFFNTIQEHKQSTEKSSWEKYDSLYSKCSSSSSKTSSASSSSSGYSGFVGNTVANAVTSANGGGWVRAGKAMASAAASAYA